MAEIGAILRKQQAKLIETLAKKSHFNAGEVRLTIPENPKNIFYLLIEKVEGLLGLYRRLCEGVDIDRLDRTR